ncbi:MULTISPECIES: hypothetical protein [Streptomyces]|uniref:hypothetical protein n=1 Tax=Streptomyces TaxID=1883 RepID=UPI0030D5B81F
MGLAGFGAGVLGALDEVAALVVQVALVVRVGGALVEGVFDRALREGDDSFRESDRAVGESDGSVRYRRARREVDRAVGEAYCAFGESEDVVRERGYLDGATAPPR